MTQPRASVIVCTRDRPESLAGCLDSILADGSTVARELIVVENGSATSSTADVVRARAHRLSDLPLHYVVEPQLGHAHARNRGVAEARGEILLFTDDDVLVEDGWADALVAAFDDDAVGAAGGRILPAWPYDPPRWLDGPHATLLTLIDHGTEARAYRPGEHPLGANMAFRRDRLRALDPPFDPRLGHRGEQRMAHEEVHALNQVARTHTVAYRPDAVVYHCIVPARMDLSWMRTTFFELGLGLGRRERLEGSADVSRLRAAVRAARLLRAARAHRRRNDRSGRVGAETWTEFHTYMWAARHLEILLGRTPRLTSFIGKRIG